MPQLLFEIPDAGDYLLSPRMIMLIDDFRRNPQWWFGKRKQVRGPQQIEIRTTGQLPEGTVEVRSSDGDLLATCENIRCKP